MLNAHGTLAVLLTTSSLLLPTMASYGQDPDATSMALIPAESQEAFRQHVPYIGSSVLQLIVAAELGVTEIYGKPLDGAMRNLRERARLQRLADFARSQPPGIANALVSA